MRSLDESDLRVEADRRSFLASAGRFAMVVPPAMTLLLSTTMSSPAIAASGGVASPGSPGAGDSPPGTGATGNPPPPGGSGSDGPSPGGPQPQGPQPQGPGQGPTERSPGGIFGDAPPRDGSLRPAGSGTPFTGPQGLGGPGSAPQGGILGSPDLADSSIPAPSLPRFFGAGERG